MYDCIIIGAGISGMTSAIYLCRAGKKVLMIDKNGYGGQIVNALKIDNYPGLYPISGFELVNNIYEQALDLGAEYVNDEVIAIKEHDVITSNKTYHSQCLIIATGCSNRLLNLDNEKHFIGHGLSYCATCDGAFYKDKVVAVYGGGNTALDDALYLSSLAKKVYLIYRGKAFKYDTAKLAAKDNVIMILDNRITKIVGQEKITGIQLDNHSDLMIDGLFVAIGQIPNTDFIVDLSKDQNGYLISEDCLTDKPYIFVAGDVRTKKLRQLITAASDGAEAANLVLQYLQEVSGEK